MITAALLLLFIAQPVEDPWTALEGTTPAQWRLVWTDRPSQELTISWSTLEAGEEHAVLFDTVSRVGEEASYAAQAPAHRSGQYTLDETEVGKITSAHYHHARITGLEPSTTYWFQIQSDGERSRELHFQTGPADDRPFKLLHGGDSRTGIEDRQQINLFIGQLADKHPELIAFAHGGDYIIWGKFWAHWRVWLSQNELTTSPTGRVLPMIPTRGNHEPGPIFDEVFDNPGAEGLNYYSTDLSPEVSLLTLNTEISAAGDQAVFLEAELARLRPERRWLLAQYHRAIYPAVKDPAAAKPHWVPLFERYNLDIALESDGHAVKRTVPIRDEAKDSTGVIYIGEGGLGVPQRDPRSDRWFLQGPGMSGKSHHVVLLEFTADELRSQILAPPVFLMRGVSPEDHIPLLSTDTKWSYLAGADPADDSWRGTAFDDSSWPTGLAGFGFADEDDSTVLENMRGEYSRVYLRASLDPLKLAAQEEVFLSVRYDDGFIAYLNGVEVARSSIGSGSGALAKDIEAHEAKSWELFPLGGGAELASLSNGGPMILAIEGHNSNKSGGDFSLQPCLLGPSKESALGLKQTRVLDDFKLKARRAR